MSKFSTYDKYISQEGSYQLLPFRFERLENETIVVTNYVGEFVFLKTEELNDLVQSLIDGSLRKK